jgi:RNA polymerase sigma-54 factor
MAMTPKLELRQGQGLAMTPQLQQAIKLLQMSNFELQTFVEAELERNPLLEQAEPQDEASPTTKERRRGEESERPAASPAGASESGWSSVKRKRGGSFEASEDFDLSNTLTRETTLGEHLTQQLHLNIVDAGDRMIGGFLIGMVDEAGYLSGDVAAVGEVLGAPLADVERVLALLQDFDPAGVCARNLQECLSLQLKEAGRFDPAMEKFIQNLDLVAKRDFAQLRKLCGVEADDIKDMIAEIRRLNPKPGNAFGGLAIQSIIPDVTVKPAPDGSWFVELNSETLPRVLVNRQYVAEVKRGGKSRDERVYLSQCLANAQWLVKSLDQRARTILKVAQEIVRHQDAFLLQGVQKLKPLNLRTIADATKMHESTVSRVTSNKFMATPRGTFELRYFFSTAIPAIGDAEVEHSAEAVRHRIKEMIEAETVSDVLSDDQIVERLRTEGIAIARRTVAKYREAVGLPSSVQRRREKRLQA